MDLVERVPPGRALKPTIDAIMRDWVGRAPEVARKNCPTGSPDAGGCADYHGIRPFLYCSGLRTSFDTYCEVFTEPVRQSAGESAAPRVLVSAAADFVVPAVVTDALLESGRDPVLVIVDRCRTPLLMCEDAAPRLGMHWRTEQGDVRAHRATPKYDLVVSDRFLSLFHPSARTSVIEAWRDQLQPRGHLVTTVTVYPDDALPAWDGETLRRETLRRLDASAGRPTPETNVERVLAMVETYNRFRHDHCISSESPILTLLEGNGFSVVGTCKFRRNSDAGLETDGTRHIVRIVAQRDS